MAHSCFWNGVRENLPHNSSKTLAISWQQCTSQVQKIFLKQGSSDIIRTTILVQVSRQTQYMIHGFPFSGIAGLPRNSEERQIISILQTAGE